MMPRRLALRDKPLTHVDGKRKIRQSVAMQVAKFPAADAKLDASALFADGLPSMSR